MFVFLTKINKNDLRWFRNNKILQKIIYTICLHNFLIDMFLFLELFLDEPTMVLWYMYERTVMGVARHHASLEVDDQGTSSVYGNVALFLVHVFGNGTAHAHSNSVSEPTLAGSFDHPVDDKWG